MFLGKSLVFHNRLKWDVTLQDGREVDEYDRSESPIYVVALDMGELLVPFEFCQLQAQLC